MRKNYHVLYTLSSDNRRLELQFSKNGQNKIRKLIKLRHYFDIRVARIVNAQYEIAQQPKHKHKTK